MSAEDEVRAAEERLRGAITSQDWTALEAILSPDLVYTHANAMVQNKDEYLAGMRKMAHRYACERRNLVVHTYGEAAFSAGRQINTTVGLGVTYHQVIQVWHKIDGDWKLEAQQSTRLPEPEP